VFQHANHSKRCSWKKPVFIYWFLFFSTFLSGDLCELCQNPCVTCTNITSCLTCTNEFLLLNDQCVEACPDGYYSYNQQCLQCHPICSTCTGK
jgi:hypothetical protein